ARRMKRRARYQNPVPKRLSFLNDSSGTLGEQARVIGQNGEDSHDHHGDGNNEKHPCAPPVQRASRHKKKESVKRDVEGKHQLGLWVSTSRVFVSDSNQ